MVKTETNTAHPAAFIDQSVATPHQPALPVPKCRQVRQLPPRGSQELRRFWLAPFILRHSLSLASLSSSLREGAKGTSRQTGSIPPAALSHQLAGQTVWRAVRYRAGQGTNVLVQALCVIVRRHCRPGGFGNQRIGTQFAASLKKPAGHRWAQMGTGVQRALYVYDYSAEIR